MRAYETAKGGGDPLMTARLRSSLFRDARVAAAVIILLSCGALCADESKPSLFRGSDGQFDTSAFLATRGGFLPVPLLITEPAVGYGGGLGVVFFHGGNPLSAARQQGGSGGRFIPPSITGAAAFATENGSKGGGAGHVGIWRNDQIRYIGFAGAASLNLDYWGTGSKPLQTPLRYEVSGAIIAQRLMFRIADSPVFLGGEWTYSTQAVKFKSALLPPDAPPRKSEQNDSGIGGVATFETLDNLFTPFRGMKGRIVAKAFSESIGGDNNRQTLVADGFGYVPLHPRLNLGMRGKVSFSDGETPFYLLPYLDMRGLPAMKYSGKHAALGELEVRWIVHGRWSAVGFGGVGTTASSAADLASAKAVGTVGGGFRYLLAERLGIHTGIDYARGPDDKAIYLIVGNAWQ